MIIVAGLQGIVLIQL